MIKCMNMKNKIKILLPFFGLALLLIACTPEEYEMGPLLNKSDLSFTVSIDQINPNKVILESLTPNVTPFWETPSGYSTNLKDTIIIPFPTTDTIYYSVESAGGLVQADPYPITISTIDEDYVNSEMWVNLTGGYNQSKTWVLDLDANGISKYFVGAIYFAGPEFSWEWDAGWADWIMPKGNYGTMTFDLIGDAHFSSNNPMLGTSATGKFMLYTDKSQLSTFGAEVLHDDVQGGQVDNWTTKLTIKSLTADAMQLVVVRDADTWLIYNYITKDYYDSH